MVKIICVRGGGNSGKTTSIRKFLEDRGVFFPLRPRDVRVVLQIEKKGETQLIGVISAGDDAEQIRKNFAFLEPYNCDYVVCALKNTSQGAVDEMQRWIDRLGADFAPIASQKLARGTVDHAAIDLTATNIANQIWNSIP